MYTEEYIIENMVCSIIDEFNFEDILKIMHFMDWTYYRSKDKVTIEELKDYANKVLHNIAEHIYNGHTNISYTLGRFLGTYSHGIINLQFITGDVIRIIK